MYKINKKVLDNKELNIISVVHKDIEVKFMDYGATVLDIKTKNTKGEMESVVLEYKNLDSYFNDSMYLNAIVGPVAGRIKDATFSIDDSPYHIEANFLETVSLHSGSDCLGFKTFDFEILDEDTQTQVIFNYYSNEASSNFPGNQHFQIAYTVRNSELKIEFMADTTEPTLVNMTSHMYFNLSGNIERQVLDNDLWINSSNTMKLDEKYVPITVEPLLNTHLDFTKSRTLNEVFTKDIYKRPENGIDNPYLLDDVDYNKSSITLRDSISKRRLDVFTTYPCVVVYTHNSPTSKEIQQGNQNDKHLGICFETQNPPNGVNIENLESSILRKGEDYYYKTLYKFSLEE